MRRALIILLGLGMAATLPASEEPRPQITGHEFEPWRWSTGDVVCQYFDPERPTRGTCDRPESEHARVPEGSEVSGDPGQ